MKKVWIQVKPNKKQVRVKKKQKLPVITKPGLEVWLTASPVQGKANQQLINVLSEYWQVAPNMIVLLKGNANQFKLVAINN